MKTKVFLLLSFLGAVTANGMDLTAVTGKFGVAIINNTAPTAPSPVVNTLGASFDVSIQKGLFLSLQPSLDIFWTNYEWFDGRAVPTEIESGGGNNVFVLGLLVDIPVIARFRFSDRIGGAASIGPAFLFRLSFAGDTNPDSEPEMAENLSQVAAYFWQSGRWLYPSASLRLDVYLQDNLTFEFGARGFLPIFNLWDPDVPFMDHAMLNITLGMRVAL